MIHTKEDLKRYLYADREAQPPHPQTLYCVILTLFIE